MPKISQILAKISDTVSSDVSLDEPKVVAGNISIENEGKKVVLQVVDLYERDPIFKALVTFYIQKDGERVLNQLLSGVKSKQVRSHRRQYKYKPDELANKYLQVLNQCSKVMPTQTELETATGIEQSIWSRMMDKSEFWSYLKEKIQEEYLKMEEYLKSQEEKKIQMLHIAEKRERLARNKAGDIIKHKAREVSDIVICGKSLTHLIADSSTENDPSVAADRALLKNKSDKDLINAIMKKRPDLTLEHVNDISRDALETTYLDLMDN